MTRDHRRAYRILGIPPGSPKDTVKQAYRDLAQVWHPDRFQHSDRLHEKAQKNLARINEAFAVLKDHEPSESVRTSRLSMTMSAVMDLGDIMQTREIHRMRDVRQPPGRNRDVVLGVGDMRATGVRRRSKRSTPWLVWVAMMALIALLGFAIVQII